MKTKWFIINRRSKTFHSWRMVETLAQAWKKTIEKWELIVNGYYPDGAISTCGLCNLYNPFCGGCPVRIIATGSGCVNTPFKKWCDSSSKDNAIAELEFLKDVKKNVSD